MDKDRLILSKNSRLPKGQEWVVYATDHLEDGSEEIIFLGAYPEEQALEKVKVLSKFSGFDVKACRTSTWQSLHPKPGVETEVAENIYPLDDSREEVEPTPVEPTPVEPTPVEPTPVEPTPVEPTPVEPTPVEPTPVEPTPVEPEKKKKKKKRGKR